MWTHIPVVDRQSQKGRKEVKILLIRSRYKKSRLTHKIWTQPNIRYWMLNSIIHEYRVEDPFPLPVKHYALELVCKLAHSYSEVTFTGIRPKEWRNRQKKLDRVVKNFLQGGWSTAPEAGPLEGLNQRQRRAMEGLLRIAGAWQVEHLPERYWEVVYLKQLAAETIMHEMFIIMSKLSGADETLWVKRAEVFIDQTRAMPGGELVIDWS
jgi:hypothetical protein